MCFCGASLLRSLLCRPVPNDPLEQQLQPRYSKLTSVLAALSVVLPWQLCPAGI